MLLLLLSTGARAEPPPPIAPVGRNESVPDHAWDLRKLTLDLDVDPAAGSVAGSATFDLDRYPGGGPLVLQEIGLDVHEVTRDGRPVPFRVEPDALVIDVDGPPPPDAIRAASAPAGLSTGSNADSVTVVVRYSATPRTGLHFRRPGPGSPDTYAEVWSQGEGTDNRYWFPGFDHPNDRFVYEGHIRGPDGWKVLTNSGQELVNYLVMLAMGPYEVAGDDAHAVWAPPGTPRDAVAALLDPIPAMQAHYQARTGVAYPWGPYRQVVVQRFIYGGMENTSATVESSRLLAGPVHRATRPGNESVVAHELAHQWFGDLLTCRDWHHLWLNEGFATFFAADWMAFGRRDGGAAWAWAESARGWNVTASDRGSLTGAWFLGPDTPPNHRVYEKGAAVLNMLRTQLGEDTFWAGIRRYAGAHAHSLVVTGDLQRAMEEASGRNLDWFFQQWTELPYVPTLKAKWSREGSDLVVTLDQVVSDGRPAYTLPVTLEVDTGGAPRIETVWMKDAHLTVQIPVERDPAFVAVDPGGALLVDLAEDQTVAEWSAQLRSSTAPYARLVAADALGKHTGAESGAAVTTLSTALGDASLPVELRKAAAAALGELRATEPLLTAARRRDDPPLLRLSVAGALAKAARPADAAAIADLLAGEPNGDLRAALTRALAAADPRRGAVAARRILATKAAIPGSDLGAQDVEYRAATDILGEHGEPSDLPALLAAPASRDRRTSGLTAATRIVSRLPLGPARDAARRTVARSAEALLDDLDLRGREAAVGVLREVGDADSATRLERFRREEEVETLLDSVTDALAAIRAREDKVTPPTPNEVDARLRSLEERLGSIEDREKKWMAH